VLFYTVILRVIVIALSYPYARLLCNS